MNHFLYNSLTQLKNHLYRFFSSVGKQNRDSLPELASHFSISLDYGPDSPLNADQISFNNLKEKTELALSSESGGGSVTGGQGVSSKDIVFEASSGANVASIPGVTFESMVGQSARGVSGCGWGCGLLLIHSKCAIW